MTVNWFRQSTRLFSPFALIFYLLCCCCCFVQEQNPYKKKLASLQIVLFLFVSFRLKAHFAMCTHCIFNRLMCMYECVDVYLCECVVLDCEWPSWCCKCNKMRVCHMCVPAVCTQAVHQAPTRGFVLFLEWAFCIFLCIHSTVLLCCTAQQTRSITQTHFLTRTHRYFICTTAYCNTIANTIEFKTNFGYWKHTKQNMSTALNTTMTHICF